MAGISRLKNLPVKPTKGRAGTDREGGLGSVRWSGVSGLTLSDDISTFEITYFTGLFRAAQSSGHYTAELPAKILFNFNHTAGGSCRSMICAG